MRNLKTSEAALRREPRDANPLSDPFPLVRLGARIEDISGFEPEPLRRAGTRCLFFRRPGSGVAMLAVAATLFAAITGAAILGPRAVGETHARPSPTASPTASLAVLAQATLSNRPSESLAIPSSTPYLALGWPIRRSGGAPEVQAGPNGIVYVRGQQPVSSSGLGLAGWLKLPEGSYAWPVLFASDGTIYAEDTTDRSPATQLIWAFNSDGVALAGWPVGVPRDGRFEEGFKGRLYVFSPSQVDVIGRDAQEMPGWPVERASDVAVVRADGTVFMGLRIPASDGSATGRLDVTVIDWRGSQIAWSMGGWSGMSISPDGGTVYAWAYEGASNSESTTVAALADDANPAKGWPVVFDGPASPPAFYGDGTVFMILGGDSPRIIALDTNGHTKLGWPVSMPPGSGSLATDDPSYPDVPKPPVIGSDGTVYLAQESGQGASIAAYDQSSDAVPGWGYSLYSGSFARFAGSDLVEADRFQSPILVEPKGGALYVALEQMAVTVSHDGLVVGMSQLASVDWPARRRPHGGGRVDLRIRPSVRDYARVVVSRQAPAGPSRSGLRRINSNDTQPNQRRRPSSAAHSSSGTVQMAGRSTMWASAGSGR